MDIRYIVIDQDNTVQRFTSEEMDAALKNCELDIGVEVFIVKQKGIIKHTASIHYEESNVPQNFAESLDVLCNKKEKEYEDNTL